MFRKVYAQIGLENGELVDEEEADRLTKEITPPTTPVVEPTPAPPPTSSFSLTQFISLNLNKITSKSQPSPPAPPKNQSNQQRPPSSTASPTVLSPNTPHQPATSSPNTNNQSTSLSPSQTHSTIPPLQNSTSNTSIPNTSTTSFTPAIIPSPRGSSQNPLSPPLLGQAANNSPSFPPPLSSSMPRNLSSTALHDSPQPIAGIQMRTSASSNNLQDAARQSPIPLIPTPPLSNSPVVPVSVRTDSPQQERPIPPTAVVPTIRQSDDSTSFFITSPPSVPTNSSLSSVKRVSSVPQMAPNPAPFPFNATRRNSNTPSPLSQPWPSPEKPSAPPSLPTSPQGDMDDEEESLINRSSNVSIPAHPRPSSQPTFSSTSSSSSSPSTHAPQPARSSPQASAPNHLQPRPASQPTLSVSQPLTSPPTLHPIPEQNMSSSQPLPSPSSSSSSPAPSTPPFLSSASSPAPPTHAWEGGLLKKEKSVRESFQLPEKGLSPPAHPPAYAGDTPLPNTPKPSLRESFNASDRSLTGSGSSAASEAPAEEVVKSGWMTKQEDSKESWFPYYFSLTPTSLLYYEAESDANPKGKITLEGYEMIIVDPEEVEKQFCFMLTHTHKRVFYIHCETREEMLSWIIAVQDILDTLKPNGTAPVKQSLVPIAETDPKYELVYAMLHAIRFSVSKMAALPYLDIGLEELNASTSFSTAKQGSASVQSCNYPYSFVDYAPKAFRKIREIFGFNCADYLLSLASQYTLSEMPTPGKSGSFFYYSNDRKFMLKTISATEFDTLRQMLPNYFLHILQNPNTLLTRLFGLHKISTENSRSIIFVVMENIFLDYEMEETYDLKGSTIGRKSDGTSTILKDLDWKRRILLNNDRINSLLFQIELDCKFLSKNNIMDYSFLLGLRFINHQDEERNKRPYSSIFQQEKGGFQATTEEGGLYDIVYYFGIIDIFTTYNIKKQLEHTYKSTIYETKDAISVVDAAKYANRFRKFITSICGWQAPKN